MKADTAPTLVFDQQVLVMMSREIMRYPDLEVAGLCRGEVAEQTRVSSIEFSNAPRAHRTFCVQGADRPDDPVVCVFHSHPSGARSPSIGDIQSMRMRRIPWVIAVISGSRVQLAAFLYDDHVIRYVPLCRSVPAIIEDDHVDLVW